MIRRTINPADKDYADYGARGIKICRRWLVFDNFLADMGRCPPGMWLERIDNSRGYEPKNCRWTTPKANNRNKRSNRLIEFQGIKLPLRAWAEKLHINRTVIERRLKRGVPAHMALRKGCMSNSGDGTWRKT